jgi:hypothetical protein
MDTVNLEFFVTNLLQEACDNHSETHTVAEFIECLSQCSTRHGVRLEVLFELPSD